MVDLSSEKSDSVAAIVWDQWAIVERLAQERDDLKNKVVEELVRVISEEVEDRDTTKGGIYGESRRRASGRGVEAKYYLLEPAPVDSPDSEGESTSLGAIVVELQRHNDGSIHAEVSATLPQQRIFGHRLEDSRAFIRKQVEAADPATSAEVDMDEVVNLEDIENATGRNEIAKRVVHAAPFESKMTLEDNIDRFVQDVLAIYKIYTQIPSWLAKLRLIAVS